MELCGCSGLKRVGMLDEANGKDDSLGGKALSNKGTWVTERSAAAILEEGTGRGGRKNWASVRAVLIIYSPAGEPAPLATLEGMSSTPSHRVPHLCLSRSLVWRGP